MKNEIVIFENQNVKLEVNMQDETVWLNTSQMAKLFNKEESNIRRHIINIFKDGELEKNNNVQKIHVDGVKQSVPFYSLDVIISVGYRVKSKNGVIFRKWANKVLKEYLLKGYVVNQRRLDYLEKTVKLLDIANRSQDRIENDEIKSILNVISSYSKALDLLDDYDIYGSFDGKDVYQSIEEKCANVLYLTVKNHAFIDGNKRIAATIFIYFLNKYNILYKDDKKVIDNNTLASITLLIAESNPKEKELMIDLVMNFLNSKEGER